MSPKAKPSKSRKRKRSRPAIPAEHRRSDGTPREGDTGGGPDRKMLRAVRRMYLGQVRPGVIATALAEKFGVSSRTVQRYIVRVREECKVHDQEERADELAQFRAGMLDIATKARRAGEYNAARLSLAEVGKVRGLYPTQKVQVDMTAPAGVLVIGAVAPKSADDWAASHAAPAGEPER